MSADAGNARDVVRVYTGSVVNAELYQQALRDAGIDAKVVGLELSASLGPAIPNSVELWVKSEEAEKARAAIEQFETDTIILA
ncbi:MAG: putative signal transducing protein [Gemmata sp.]